MIKVEQLPESPARGVVLRCWNCGEDWSAAKDDYFLLDDTEVMACDCGNLCNLVKRTVVYTSIEI